MKTKEYPITIDTIVQASLKKDNTKLTEMLKELIDTVNGVLVIKELVLPKK